MDPEPETPNEKPVQQLNRLACFKHLQVPTLVKDLLHRNEDDVKFQELLDDARMRRLAQQACQSTHE